MGLVYGELGIFHPLNQYSIMHAIFSWGFGNILLIQQLRKDGVDISPANIGLCMTRLWCRMMNMCTDRLNSRVFKWAKYAECKQLEQ